MSIKPHERFERVIALDTLTAQLAEAQRRLRAAQRRIEALETQMRREGWTQADLDEVESNLNH
jgi:hypothetical protein